MILASYRLILTFVSATTDWGWIGEQVKARRESLNLGREDVRARSNGAVSVSTLLSIEKGEKKDRQPVKLAQLAEALDWPRNAFDLLRQGQVPPSITGASVDTVTQAKLDQILEVVKRQESMIADLIGLRSQSPGPPLSGRPSRSSS